MPAQPPAADFEIAGAGQSPAGWYIDPDESGRLRYWSGHRWTDEYAVVSAMTMAAAAERPWTPPTDPWDVAELLTPRVEPTERRRVDGFWLTAMAAATVGVIAVATVVVGLPSHARTTPVQAAATPSVHTGTPPSTTPSTPGRSDDVLAQRSLLTLADLPTGWGVGIPGGGNASSAGGSGGSDTGSSACDGLGDSSAAVAGGDAAFHSPAGIPFMEEFVTVFGSAPQAAADIALLGNAEAVGCLTDSLVAGIEGQARAGQTVSKPQVTTGTVRGFPTVVRDAEITIAINQNGISIPAHFMAVGLSVNRVEAVVLEAWFGNQPPAMFGPALVQRTIDRLNGAPSFT